MLWELPGGTMMKLSRICLVTCGLLSLAACGEDATPSETLRILVTNDDGVEAEGIDELVEALTSNPANEVIVCAPDGNRSGSGDTTGPSQRCGNLSVFATTTRSGYPSTAIDGCPADAVNYALDSLYPDGSPPDVVIAGINEGQNISAVISSLSGTVGAAKTAARRGVPSLAASQGLAPDDVPPDYPAGARAVLTWLEQRRSALGAGTAPTTADSVNIPTCTAGAIRGTLVGLPLASSAEGAVDPQNCESTLDDPADDVQAFVNGFTTLTTVPLD